MENCLLDFAFLPLKLRCILFFRRSAHLSKVIFSQGAVSAAWLGHWAFFADIPGASRPTALCLCKGGRFAGQVFNLLLQLQVGRMHDGVVGCFPRKLFLKCVGSFPMFFLMWHGRAIPKIVCMTIKQRKWVCSSEYEPEYFKCCPSQFTLFNHTKLIYSSDYSLCTLVRLCMLVVFVPLPGNVLSNELST